METAPAAGPESADDWYRLGNTHQDEGRDDLAVACYERAVDLLPGHAQAWNNLGASRHQLGLEEPAAAAYRRALAIDPSLRQATVNLAHLFRERGDLANAEPLFARAAALEPADPATWEALGRLRMQLALHDQALEAFRGWLDCDRTRLEPYLGLASVEIARGNPAAAEPWFLGALAHHPDDPTLRHMLAAVRGQTTAAPAEGYVERLFDGMALEFEQQLRKLGYQDTLGALARMLLPLLPRDRPARVLDLGCGTGLMGAELAPCGARITGVDLSAGMLARAQARGVYAQLVKSDLAEYLRAAGAGSFDAVLAADVFVYLGELEPVFEGAARVLVPGGVFAFSVEALEGGGFALRSNGRYAHSTAYLRAIAARRGLSERGLERIRLRIEYGVPVQGWLGLFTR